MLSNEEFKEEINRVQGLKNQISSYKTYNYRGSDLIDFMDEMIEALKMLHETRTELEELKKKKHHQRIVYKARK